MKRRTTLNEFSLGKVYSGPRHLARIFLFTDIIIGIEQGICSADNKPSVAVVWERKGEMETRIALIGVIVENTDSVEELNRLLSEYGDYIFGRMGLPHREKKVNVISIAIDAPNDIISALSGKLGMLPGISTKTTYAKV